MGRTGEDKAIAASMIRILAILAMLVLPFITHESGIIGRIDNHLVDLRFEAAPRSATGNIVYVAIDKKSLDTVGVWPWPRSVHAQLIDKLVAAGAGDIFLDVDFSTPSDPREDARLARALADAGGGVILPVFRQTETAYTETAVWSRPIPALAENAWLAVANVFADPDGAVRSFPAGAILDGVPTQSVGAMLAGSQRVLGDVPIDFSIDPSTVPTISAADVLTGERAGIVEGRTVVVGAYATELRDVFTVPVHGVMTGPLLHILGAETMLQGRVLRSVDQTLIELVFAVLVVATVFVLGRRSLLPVLAGAAALVLLGESTAFLLQKEQALLIHTTAAWLTLAFGLFMLMNEKVDISRLLVEIVKAENRNARRLLKRIVADSADGVVAFDDGLKIIEASRSAGPILGRENIAKAFGPLSSLVPASVMHAVEALAGKYDAEPGRVVSRTLQFALTAAGETRHLEASITISPAEKSTVIGRVREHPFVGCLIIRDMTVHHLYREKLSRLARYDDLTGLLNRRAFTDRLEALTSLQGVAVLDMHRFSVLNATLGRDTGDALLKALGERLSKAYPKCAGRLGGDVFCVALRGAEPKTEAQWADELLRLFEDPFRLPDTTLQVAARLGISLRRDKARDGVRLIEEASNALDDAKTVAGGGWKAFDPQAAETRDRARWIERELRGALERGEFHLAYQPQVDLKMGRLVGAEALLRWNHWEKGFISPAEFIPVAEANGFICELGRWVLAKACGAAARWPEGLSVSVNLSPVQFARTDVEADIRRTLAESGLPPERLHLEITESTFIEGSGHLSRTIQALREEGVTIALDDFGTGYSSLSYIGGFPLDILKIDQSFVRRMATDPTSRTIVKAILSLTRGLGLRVVAEGIETETEWQMLARMGCEMGQGYYFGKPQSADELLRLMDRPTWEMKAA